MKHFEGKVAAITGASSGIGRALAKNLAKQKCHLALSDIDETGLSETVEMVSDSGVDVTQTIVNVANKDEVHGWADQVVKDHGKVNLIFNNAGVALGGTVEDTSYEDFEWILGINMWGVVYGTKAFLPYIRETGDGHIVNVSSVFGLFSQPTQSGYNMSKFAVRGFTESLRQELDLEQCGVSATCVHPGGIKTNIAKNARMSEGIEKLTGTVANAEKLRQKFESMFMTSSERAAKDILNGVKHDKRRVLIGPDARFFDVMQRSFPVSYQKMMATSFKYANR